MSEMKLIMESWRAFRLVEEEGPEYKEDPKDTLALLKALSTESDIQRKEKVIHQILADKDVAEVIEALGEMFQEITSEEDIEVDIDEGLDDLGRSIAGAGLNLTAKVEEFLSSSPAGRVLGTIAPPLLGLALGVLMIQGGDASAAGLKTVGKLVSGAVTPETLGDAVMDLGAEALEGIQERKKI
jgi:hypothetical protein|tara:strand:- start:8 stop:559 length:552 start_codon:yes stop_codon:yes gene_type:complete